MSEFDFLTELINELRRVQDNYREAKQQTPYITGVIYGLAEAISAAELLFSERDKKKL